MGGSLEIVPSGPLSGSIEAPPSKSLTNRLLVVAALARGTSRLVGPLESDDTQAMAAGLEGFGVPVERDGGDLVVTGCDGAPRPPTAPVDARMSGTTLRFLSAVAVLVRGATTLDGSPQLRRRPIGPLAGALGSLGASVDTAGGYPPVTVRSEGLGGGEVEVDASRSSQFATAVLLVAPYAAADLVVRVVNLQAAGYVELTLEVMGRFGAEVAALGGGAVRVAAGHHYSAHDERVEYDASAAAHLLALAVATGGRVTIANAAARSLQPDAAVVALLAAAGAVVERDGDAVTVSGPEVPLPVEADLAPMPDQLPTLATLAALAEGTSTFRGLAVTRGHESDRLVAVAEELGGLGVATRAGDDWLEVLGRGPDGLRGGLVDTREDHRMAMAFTAIGARVGGVRIGSPQCVGKTYPGFFSDAARLGLVIRPEG